MFNSEMLILPVLMTQATHLMNALKTNWVIVDLCVFAAIFMVYIMMDTETMADLLKHVYTRYTMRNQITLVYEKNAMSTKFRAVMHFIAKHNKHVQMLKEVAIWQYGDHDEETETSDYVVDQRIPFILDDGLMAYIEVIREETQRGTMVEIKRLTKLHIRSDTLSLEDMQSWIDSKVRDYKTYLRQRSNDHQLIISAMQGGSSGKGRVKGCRNNEEHSQLELEPIPWQSNITFANSYFHDQEVILEKIHFFLNNEQWYKDKGIPYNLGILLYGEPGCGKTRFIKQLMNLTQRHAIDIKLNDKLDFLELQRIIFDEELDENLIIPQNQRILIFEDIDAMGDVVKDRSKIKSKLSTVIANATEDTLAADFVNLNAVPLLGGKAIASRSVDNLDMEKLNNNLSFLLNMLDGIHECHGRILIMSTNHEEVLDKALIRPGRIDIKIRFTKCTRYDLAQHINLFWGLKVQEQDVLPSLEGQLTSADVSSLFRSSNQFAKIAAEFLVPEVLSTYTV